MRKRHGKTIRWFKSNTVFRLTFPEHPVRFGGRWKPFQVSLKWVIISKL